ncbi:hypothetical protein AIOL_001713 [Candidatus Rhodobacter oscarellae]|uniref:Uncharacterized protein n=1 Tax=Candidatus Rhodobacter oscarellae TaxID=1675527 RepID=A0A0J9E238_9RHOB|nr:hypothetical protein AIOL_001713 [Candidatus Rhodobacter lobularis]
MRLAAPERIEIKRNVAAGIGNSWKSFANFLQEIGAASRCKT